MEYFVWESKAGKGACVLTALKNVDGVVDIKRGRSKSANFSDDAFFEMNPNYPKDILLEDQIGNHDRLIVASLKLTNFIKLQSIDYMEYLPVTIINHKNRAAADDYSILHPCKVIDCIDKDNSSLKWNNIDLDLISGCLELVLDENKLSDELIFRPRHLEMFVFVREDFADQINSQNFTGVDLTPLDEFEY